MHVAIMGSGGIGGYLGVRLASGGTRVSFIARGMHLEAMKRMGLKLRSELGDRLIKPIEATDEPGQVGPVDMVLFTVKLYDTDLAARACRPLLGPATGVVTFQNGVESVDLLSSLLGRAHVIGGLAVIASMIAEPGVIEHTGAIARFVLGELDEKPSERAQRLVSAFRMAGVEAHLSEQIELEIWEKFIALAAWSGISALTRASFGVVRAHEETRRLLIDAVQEVVAVARAKGVALRPGALDRSLSLLLENAPAAVRASMLRDLEQGKRLELPWLSGLVVRLGRELGVPTPTHTTIVAALAPYVDGAPRELQ